MAESIIKNPFQSYIIIAESGSGSDTYKNKLLSLKSAFESLGEARKRKSFILVGNRIYRIQYHISTQVIFSSIMWGTDDQTIGSYVIMDLVTGNRKIFSITSDGTRITDGTDGNVSLSIQLGYWL